MRSKSGQASCVPGGAVHGRGGGDWGDHGARAVGDGQGGGLEGCQLGFPSSANDAPYLSGSVGDAVEADLGGGRADGGVGSQHIGGVGHGVVGTV